MAVNRSSFITVHQEAIVFTAQISDIRAHCQLQFIHHENNDVFAHLLLKHTVQKVRFLSINSIQFELKPQRMKIK